MESRTQPPIHIEDLSVVDVEVAFILAVGGMNPATVNPDFLRYNEIVPPEWQVRFPVAIEPGYCRVRYDGGISITSTPQQLVFSQAGDSLGSWNDACLGVLKRFLSMAPPPLDYRFVAIAPRSIILRPSVHPGEPASILTAAGKGVQLAGVSPDVHVRLSYQVNGSDISVYVSEAVTPDKPSVVETRFRGHFRHRVAGNELSEKRTAVEGILDHAGDDVSVFHELARQFVMNSLTKEQ